MKTFAQWVLALTRGYIKATGKRPNKLDQLRIKMEAGQKVKDQKKVIEFPQDRITDWTKERPEPGMFDNIFAKMQKDMGKKPKVVKTEAQIKKELEKQNKESIQRFKDKMKDPEDFAGGGIAGMLGEPTYVDDSHRVPYGGGGAGKPPITFTLQGGGSYGSNEIGPGLDLTQSGYGFNLGTNIDLPFGFSATGNVGIGRGKTEVDYNDQNVFTGVDETKLGDKWNVGLKWSKEFNEGGRVPLRGGKWVLEELMKLANKIAPGSTKVGQTSKTMAEKTGLKKAIADFQERQTNKKLIDEDIKLIAKEQDLDEKSVRRIWDDHIADEGGIGSLDEFHADFVKETGINVSKDNLRKAWRMKRSYPFNTPIVDKTGKDIGGEATQKMYPESKKFIVKDSDTLTKEIEGKLPSGERAGIDVPHMPAGFKLSREKLEQNFPELGLDEIDEIMNLDKEMQGRVITMLKNRRLDPDLYDELLLKHGDTLEFQGEFDKAIRRKKNASGGLAGMLGE